MNTPPAESFSGVQVDAGAPLKPEVGDLSIDLVEFESNAAAERLGRLAADRELVQTLQWLSFSRESEEWGKLAYALVEYGYSVFKGWFITGVAVERAKARHVRGITRLPAILKLDQDDAHALAADLMVDAVEVFRAKVLARNKWDAERGATLKTYFVGHCLFQLPDVYKRWRRDEDLVPVSFELTRDLEQRGELAEVGTRAVESVRLEAVIDLIDNPETIAMFELFSAGFSYDEVADMLDVTEAVVRTRLSRARAAVRSAVT